MANKRLNYFNIAKYIPMMNIKIIFIYIHIFIQIIEFKLLLQMLYTNIIKVF